MKREERGRPSLQPVRANQQRQRPATAAVVPLKKTKEKRRAEAGPAARNMVAALGKNLKQGVEAKNTLIFLEQRPKLSPLKKKNAAGMLVN